MTRAGRPTTRTNRPRQEAVPVPATPSPHVAAAARRLGIDAADVVGTGVGGRVSMADVQAMAAKYGPRTPAGPPPARAMTGPAPARSYVQELESEWVMRARVRIDAYALNPLVDDYRQANPQDYAKRVEILGAPPTAFVAGDLPIYLASAEDPKVLLTVPWRARHGIAALPAGPEFAEALERCAGPDANEATSLAAIHYAHHGATDYQQRVQAWINAQLRRPGDPGSLTLGTYQDHTAG